MTTSLRTPLIQRNASIAEVADVIADNYEAPPDILEQFGRAFACRTAEEVAGFASQAAGEPSGRSPPTSTTRWSPRLSAPCGSGQWCRSRPRRDGRCSYDRPPLHRPAPPSQLCPKSGHCPKADSHLEPVESGTNVELIAKVAKISARSDDPGMDVTWGLGRWHTDRLHRPELFPSPAASWWPCPYRRSPLPAPPGPARDRSSWAARNNRHRARR